MKKIAMIGVGKLGQDCAEVMADAGYDVVGYDIEPRFPKFPMKDSIEEAVIDRDIIFIAAPTPHNPIYGGETPTSHLPNKDFDYTIVKNILSEVNNYTSRHQLVVLISTVLPGTVRNQLEPLITNARFIYNPYLIAMGTIKWDMVNPEMVIIGTEDGSLTGDAQELIEFYKVFMQNDPRYEVGTWDEAESIKIFYNTFISTKLSLVNMIQDVAETNGNINVDVVTNALKKSTYRIMGPAYMQAALGDAGACHPRDNIALRYLADRLNLGYDLFDAIMKAREVQAERMALRCLKNGKNITIIGKAYKPAVHYTNGSASMLVGHYIEKHGGNLHYYDINTGDNDMRQEWTEVYLIGYWEEWVEKLKFNYAETVVIDPWRKLKNTQHIGEIIYYGDSRPKHRYETTNDTLRNLRKFLYELFPNISQYDSSIHIIDAMVPSNTTFVLRNTEDIILEMREAVGQGKNKFVFFTATEALMPHVIGKIHRLINILSDVISPKDVFIVSGVPDGDPVYSNLCSKMGWPNKFNLLNSNWFHFVTTLHTEDFQFIGGYEPRHKGKLFLCFNKVHREHRMKLLDKMLEMNLVDRSYYSFEGTDDFLSSIDDLDRYPNIKANKELFPLRLNITDTRLNPVDTIPDDLFYFKDSYFSIVTETLCFDKNYPINHHRPYVEDGIFITEKTYRCFALLHPFIILARPHTLKELRRQGFKTFAPYIDESYDSIEDDESRFNAIIKEIRRLCNQNGNEWVLWQEGIREIVEYNHEFFYQHKDFSFTKNYVNLFLGEALVSTMNEKITNFETEAVKINTTIEITLNESVEPISVETESKTNFDSSLIKISNWINRTVVTENGLTLNFPEHIDGGGDAMKNDLFSFISSTGKIHYEKALDWCAGHGPFGFELLDKNKASSVVFQDIYDAAINSCIKNAKENNLIDKISAYVCGSISEIPVSEQFDLVVANPPHCASSEALIKNELYENTKRVIVDEDYRAHKEFFKNIKKYLTTDADVYITVPNKSNNYLIEWAKMGGLTYMGRYSLSLWQIPDAGILHFKVNNI